MSGKFFGIARRAFPLVDVLTFVILAFASWAPAEEITNSLGMKFVQVPIYNGSKVVGSVLFCTTEVTVDQYKAAGLEHQAPEFEQSGNHPVVNVSWNDAKTFCKWLSKKEGKKYRLPTDHEWSCAVGIGDKENPKTSPELLSAKIPDVYPWGNGFPPPAGAGNYNDALTHDGYKFTAPVGSFAANSLGIYDLGGNVWEWCEDEWSPGNADSSRVLRGACWDDGVGGDSTLSSARSADYPGAPAENAGFRVVCEPSGAK